MKKHTEDFKRKAVRIALSSGLSRRRVTSDLGVGLSTLGKWVCDYRPADLVAAPQADLAPAGPPERSGYSLPHYIACGSPGGYSQPLQ